jgi:hypothetical protein
MENNFKRIVRKEKNIEPPIIGKLKIGEKTEAGLPKSTDYFVASGAYKSVFNSKFGENPSRIPIFFPNVNSSFLVQEQYELWEKGVLVAYGDGEKFQVMNPTTYQFEEKGIEEIPSIENFRHTLKLRFGIRGLQDCLGVWQFETKGGKSSIENIIGTLDMVNSYGKSWQELPFDLIVSFRTKKEISGKTRKYPVVTLVAANLLESENQEDEVPFEFTDMAKPLEERSLAEPAEQNEAEPIPAPLPQIPQNNPSKKLTLDDLL